MKKILMNAPTMLIKMNKWFLLKHYNQGSKNSYLKSEARPSLPVSSVLFNLLQILYAAILLYQLRLLVLVPLVSLQALQVLFEVVKKLKERRQLLQSVVEKLKEELKEEEEQHPDKDTLKELKEEKVVKAHILRALDEIEARKEYDILRKVSRMLSREAEKQNL
jgi:hypothetical protein